MIIQMETRRRLASGEVLPLSPIYLQWIERVNNGARFRLNPRDEVYGAHGEPYLRLPLARAGEESHTLSDLALYLYNRSVGALLTLADEATSPIDTETNFPLTFGDVVDFLQTGTLEDRIPCTPPWGYPASENANAIASIERLDDILLPKNSRRQLEWLFEPMNLRQFGVSLVRGTNGLQTYWISYKTDDPLPMSSIQSIANRVCWYLPRYSAIVVDRVENGDVKGYPLWLTQSPTETTEKALITDATYLPTDAIEASPLRFTGDIARSIVDLFAETVGNQYRELLSQPSFPRAHVPLGSAAWFEVGCFNLAFLLYALQTAEADGSLTKVAMDTGVSFLIYQFESQYDVNNVIVLIQERLDYYLHEIETKWDEEENTWDLLFQGLSESLCLRIVGHQSQDELAFSTPTHFKWDTMDTGVSYAIMAMSLDLAKSCLMSTIYLIFIVRKWLASYHVSSLTPEELSTMAAQATDAANILLVFQAQADAEEEEEDEATEEVDTELSEMADAALLRMYYRNRDEMIAYGVEMLKDESVTESIWTGRMLRQYGTSIKPHLTDLWKATQLALNGVKE